jgi:hypothetical protein
MKKNLGVCAAITAISLITSARAANLEPGAIDLGKLSPVPGAEFVEVNINSNLVAMVTSLAKKAEPEIAEILKGLKSIRVNVLGLNEENREDIQGRIASVRGQLEKGGWDRIVTVVDGRDDVGVYMKTKGAEVVEGIVVTVLSGDKEAVFVNVVGDIRPEKLATVGERFNIEPLKHLPGKPAARKNDE